MKQSVKQTVKVVIGDSVLLRAGRRKKTTRRKKAVKAAPPPPPYQPPQPPKYQMFGSQIFAQPPQFLRAEPAPIVRAVAPPVVAPVAPVAPAPARRETEAAELRKRAEEASKRILTRRPTEQLPTFQEKKGTVIPEPIRSFITPRQGSMSLADMIRRESNISPIPLIKVPSFRESDLEPSSAPNRANQPSVDVSLPDPAPPTPQAPSQGSLVAAQPSWSFAPQENKYDEDLALFGETPGREETFMKSAIAASEEEDERQLEEMERRREQARQARQASNQGGSTMLAQPSDLHPQGVFLPKPLSISSRVQQAVAKKKAARAAGV